MIRKTILFATIGILAAISAGCGAPANTTNTNTASANSSANVASSVATNPAANTAASTGTINMATVPADSPAGAYKAAYNARQSKDIAALKKILAKDVLEFLTMVGKEDKKSLDDMLKDLCEQPQAATAETRNEKIEGDTASIEYLDEEGKWQPMEFVREDGMWKLSIGKMDAEPPANSGAMSNANTSK